jgi:hypothetical protein
MEGSKQDGDEYYAFKGRKAFIDRAIESYDSLIRAYPFIRTTPEFRSLNKYMTEIKRVVSDVNARKKGA